jgi:DNA modification methylase
LVLDPFGGSGTTGKVARGLGRDFALIELNEVYIRDQARVRTGLATSEEIVAGRSLFGPSEQ